MNQIQVTKENFQTIRENGIGSNFTALNPADGFRKDNKLWFATCSECGESVTNSNLNGVWMHSVTRDFRIDSGIRVGGTTSSFDYCPSA